MERLRPDSAKSAAAMLAECSESVTSVRFTGAGTKAHWGGPVEAAAEISSGGMARVLEHNAGDLTAVVEAGVTLEDAQASFAERGQMFAVDPPEGGTIGGLIATGDSGPLRHRYGAVRDLLLGATVALTDGTVARSGGKVIKNVAGYDIAKLLAGSFGTLGFIAQVSIRLHPLPPRRATLVARTDEPEVLRAAVLALARAPLELDCLDFSWAGLRGAVLARFSGATPLERVDAGIHALKGIDIALETHEDDDDLWTRQRSAQRSEADAVVRISGLPERVGAVIRAVSSLGGHVVGRAGLGVSWATFEGSPADMVGAVDELRASLSPAACVLLDGPPEVRSKAGVWGGVPDPIVALNRRIKVRFDPSDICNPGIFVGGI